jgi:hypothetical protein
MKNHFIDRENKVNEFDALNILGYKPVGFGGVWTNGSHTILVNFGRKIRIREIKSFKMRDGKVIIKKK